MKYDQAKGRAVQKKGQTGRKIFINQDADYDTALRRIREALYGETINESMQLVRSLLFQGVTFRARTVLGGVLIRGVSLLPRMSLRVVTLLYNATYCPLQLCKI